MTQQDGNTQHDWFNDARFGLFIHWGISAQFGCRWDGKPVDTYGEWIVSKVPRDDYYKQGAAFNPVKFDAEEWVRIAAHAGMRYLVITAKHVDGFVLFKSDVDDNNVVDGAAFGRDVIGELSAACQKYNLTFCVYYSQTIDYAHPGGHEMGKTFDAEAFARYQEEKVKPQLRELLTNYGPIGLIWFDNPRPISHEQSKDIHDLVKSIQPNCMCSNRIGNGFGDYVGGGDNQFLSLYNDRVWEMCGTMNNTWGFAYDDHDWKSKEELLYMLIECASRRGNYLLNVGPTGEGLIPQQSVDRLNYIGDWMAANSSAIHGAHSTGLCHDLRHVNTTRKEDKLFVIPQPQDKTLNLYGVKTRINEVKVVGDAESDVCWTQKNDEETALNLISIDLKDLPDQSSGPTVFEATLDQTFEVDPHTVHDSDGNVILSCSKADIFKGADSPMHCRGNGMIINWKDSDDYVAWTFRTFEPQDYQVKMIIKSTKHIDVSKELPESGYEMAISVNNESITHTYTLEERLDELRSKYTPEFSCTMGSIRIDEPGIQTLTLKYTGNRDRLEGKRKDEDRMNGMYLGDSGGDGISVCRLELIPVTRNAEKAE